MTLRRSEKTRKQGLLSQEKGTGNQMHAKTHTFSVLCIEGLLLCMVNHENDADGLQRQAYTVIGAQIFEKFLCNLYGTDTVIVRCS